MALSTDATELLAKFDAATTAIGNRIDALVAKSQTMSAEDKAALSAEADKLQALGSDPNNPVPPTP